MWIYINSVYPLLSHSFPYEFSSTITKEIKCRDEKPVGWKDDAQYDHKHLCGTITCADLAEIDSCTKDLSELHFTNT